MIDGRRERMRASRIAHQQAGELTKSAKVGAQLARRGVKADAITTLGVTIAMAAGIAIGFGGLYVGLVLLIIGGLMDTLDGIVAKASGSSSSRGAFFDSVADRVSDGFIFGGLAFYFLDGRNPKLALLPIAILAVGSLISYERAKAESLGFTAKGGLMERAERLILLGGALVAHVVLVPLLIVLLVLSTATAAGRFARVWRQASGDERPTFVRTELWRAEFDERWKTWRTENRARRVRRSRRELEPLTTRLRGVLSNDHAMATHRRDKPMRDRSARARRRRMNDLH